MVDRAVVDLYELRRLNLFEGLTPSDMQEILEVVTVEAFNRGEIIFRPGDVRNRLCVLHHGQIKTYAFSAQGHEKILHIFKPGDAFGGLLLDDDEEGLPWVEAMADVVVSSMNETSFKLFMQEWPDLCMNLFRYMTAHHAADMRRLESFIHTKARQRLLLVLLELSDRLGDEEEESFELPTSYTHEDLANMIGAARSTVSALVSELREAGVLGGGGRSLIVHRQKVRQLLDPDDILNQGQASLTEESDV